MCVETTFFKEGEGYISHDVNIAIIVVDIHCVRVGLVRLSGGWCPCLEHLDINCSNRTEVAGLTPGASLVFYRFSRGRGVCLLH